MHLFHEMTDQDLVASARRCQQPTYHALADRIEQRGADTLALVNMLVEVSIDGTAGGNACTAVRVRQLLERLEESGTMDKLKRIKGL